MDDDISVKEFLTIIVKQWRMILIVILITMTFSFVYSIFQPTIYQAKAYVLDRSGGGGGLSSLAAIAGIDVSRSNNQPYNISSLLKSRVVAKKVLSNLTLQKKIKGWDDPSIATDDLSQAVSNMLKDVKSSGGIFELTVENVDPKLSAEIANGFVVALEETWNQLNYTEAKKQRSYIEEQLPIAEYKLKDIETKIKNYALLTSNVKESGETQNKSTGHFIAKLLREQAIQASVYAMLRNQYESVKLEEAKELVPFSLLDKAIIPKKPIRPRIKLNVAVGLVFGLFIGVFIVFLREYFIKVEE